MTKVSVCITTFNHEQYIKQAVLSALNQSTAFEIEVLVGDDGSTDKTREIINALAIEYPERVVPVMHETRLGASGNIQALLRLAQGEYIAILDGDDYWYPGKIEKQLGLLMHDEESVAIYSNAEVVRPDGLKLGFFNNLLDSRVSLEYLVESGNFLNTSSMVFRSNCKEALTSIEEEFIDFRMHVKLASMGKLLFVSEPLVGYRLFVKNSMTSTSRDKIYLLYLDAISDAVSFGVERDYIRRSLCRVFRSILYSSLFSLNLRRVVFFQNEISKVDIFPNRRQDISWFYFMSVKEFPFVMIRHLVGVFTGKKIFFPVKKKAGCEYIA